jgi:hypothetical protein
MARFIPPHPKKGSTEAFAWAERMRLARAARKKRVREAGRITEKRFFRKGKLKPYAGMEANPSRPHGTFTRCVTKVSKSLKQYGRTGDPKKICGSALSTRYGKNPITLVGNPSHEIHAKISGVVYNLCHEIKAEKTGWRAGLYKHPFSTQSKVQILALDNGDLLIHSAVGERLWMRA